MARWTFTEVNTTNTYTFEINPSEASSPDHRVNLAYQNTAGDGGGVVFFEGGVEPITMSASGTLLTQTQYESLRTWSRKRALIDIVDDLGRSFRSRIIRFSPQRATFNGYPWAHTYDLEYVVVREN